MKEKRAKMDDSASLNEESMEVETSPETPTAFEGCNIGEKMSLEKSFLCPDVKHGKPSLGLETLT